MTVQAKSIELQLLGWSESHNAGCKVTFAVHEDDLEYFKSKTERKGKIAGQIFMAALAEVNDDGQPVPHETKKPSASKFPSGRTGLAVRWGADPDFRKWLQDSFSEPIVDESAAATMIRSVCWVDSRKLLDGPDAAERFDRLIRIPYAEDRKGRGLD